MGWNGSGSVSLLYDWSARADAGSPTHFIDADLMDAQQQDLADAIEATLNRNGENAVAADIAWGGNKITGLGDPSAATDAINASTVAENTVQYGGTTGGSSNAYTITNTFIATVGTGTRILAIANHTNDGATTLNVNGAGAVAVVRADGSTALAGNEIVSGDIFEVVYDGTSFVLIHSPQTAEGDFIDGSVTVGVNDSVPGSLSIYGGGTGETGGVLRLYNAADNDTTVEYWQWYLSGGDDLLRLQDNNGLVSFRVSNAGVVDLGSSSGTVYIGQNDSVPAAVRLYGGGAGEAGATLRLYNPADHDGTVDY